MTKPSPLKVSVIIKALNEESKIAVAISSALAAVKQVGGEVILSDSYSTDRTIEIAREYPITIVQLKNPNERRCGIGPQLGYQVATGDFIYILDGDMELDPDFLPAALTAMEQQPQLAGVAGLIEEQSEASYQFRGRKRRKSERIAGTPQWLDMGGLYRRSALHEVGYFSDRNLHAYEEMDLGLRLTHAGWTLQRLPVRSVLHYGYETGNWSLLTKRWKSRYLDGAGELLRAALGKPYLRDVAISQKHLFIGLAIWAGLIIGVLLLPAIPWLLTTTVVVTIGLIAIRAQRIGSLTDALFGQVVWQVTSLAMLRGLLNKPVDPHMPIEQNTLALGAEQHTLDE
ncbi:MAG: glycosyltransferase [Gammaproteobacteria bacterium]|nr:glycosyltransferase [Gammaproteobacteria bacterium]MCP4090220.1 glycosyltransferase [Gammaproteobacteria bacterium]MCP4832971.1 glycosyltransferase [Gammaproteobacteria bacterium]MCP4928658.1 glycosyltransferase [Gammaproteobacteria bacterium]